MNDMKDELKKAFYAFCICIPFLILFSLLAWVLKESYGVVGVNFLLFWLVYRELS